MSIHVPATGIQTEGPIQHDRQTDRQKERGTEREREREMERERERESKTDIWGGKEHHHTALARDTKTNMFACQGVWERERRLTDQKRQTHKIKLQRWRAEDKAR